MPSWLSDVPVEFRSQVREQYADAKGVEEKVAVLSKWHPLGHVNLRPVKTLEEYFRLIRICSSSTSWFRGEDRDFGHLVPKLFRNVEQDKVAEALDRERRFQLEFRRRARTFMPQVDPDDHWAWYFLVQHYGGPTRLLDWTQDAATALFFALDTCSRDEDTPIVHVLAPTALTTFATSELEGRTDPAGRVPYAQQDFVQPWIRNVRNESMSGSGAIPRSPVPIFPPHLDQRMEAQKSCFTLFGQRIHGFDGTPHAEENSAITGDPSVSGIAAVRPALIVCPCCGRRLVHKIIIDGGSRMQLKVELARAGMTAARVFPGLEGLCKELAEHV